MVHAKDTLTNQEVNRVSYRLEINCNLCGKIIVLIEGSESKNIDLKTMYSVKESVFSDNLCSDCKPKEQE